MSRIEKLGLLALGAMFLVGDGVQREEEEVVLTGFFAGLSVPDTVSEVAVVVVDDSDIEVGVAIPVSDASAEDVGAVRGRSDRTGIIRAGEAVGESPSFGGAISRGDSGRGTCSGVS